MSRVRRVCHGRVPGGPARDAKALMRPVWPHEARMAATLQGGDSPQCPRTLSQMPRIAWQGSGEVPCPQTSGRDPLPLRGGVARGAPVFIDSRWRRDGSVLRDPPMVSRICCRERALGIQPPPLGVPGKLCPRDGSPAYPEPKRKPRQPVASLDQKRSQTRRNPEGSRPHRQPDRMKPVWPLASCERLRCHAGIDSQNHSMRRRRVPVLGGVQLHGRLGPGTVLP